MSLPKVTEHQAPQPPTPPAEAALPASKAKPAARNPWRALRRTLSWRDASHLARDAVAAWLDDRAPSMGAALAYYTLFSLAPLLLIAMSVAGLAFGADAARGEIYGQLQALFGSAGAAAVQQLLESVNKPADGVLATVLGVVLMLVGATTVFAELQDALARIFHEIRSAASCRGAFS